MGEIDALKDLFVAKSARADVAERAGLELQEDYSERLAALREELAERTRASRAARIRELLEEATRAGKLWPSEHDYYREFLLDFSEENFGEGVEQVAAILQERPAALMLDVELTERNFDAPGSGAYPETREGLSEEIDSLTPREYSDAARSSGIRDFDAEDYDEGLEGGE